MRRRSAEGGGLEAHRHADRRRLGQRIARRDADQCRATRSRRSERGAIDVAQTVLYHPGVGAADDAVKHWLGGAIGLGLRAIAVDEHRRAFSPTFWTRRKAAPAPAPSRVVEQTWFAGSHGDVGGGNSDPQLANLALVWMAARLQALTGLAFDDAAMTAEEARWLGRRAVP